MREQLRPARRLAHGRAGPDAAHARDGASGCRCATPFDPRENIFGGTRYLRVLANMFNGDLELTIAGYNAGEAAVVRYAGIPPYEETQAYVVRVLDVLPPLPDARRSRSIASQSY